MDELARYAQARYAAAARWAPEKRDELAAEYAAEKWRSRVAEIVAEAPPLTDEQRAHIRGLICPLISDRPAGYEQVAA